MLFYFWIVVLLILIQSDDGKVIAKFFATQRDGFDTKVSFNK